MTDAQPLLCLKDVTRSIATPAGDKTIVDHITFEFQPCRMYTILGPSGAGKSSLLRLINRLDEPTGGDISFEGKPQRDFEPRKLRHKIGYLFQTPYLFPETIADNLRYATSDLTDDHVTALLKRVHLDSKTPDASVETLSVGEQQRVALARLLATEPTLVLLDEPTSALDPSYKQSIQDLIRELVYTCNQSAIMVTHNLEEALRMGGETLLLADGKLIEHGPVEQVVKEPQTEIGRKYRDRELR
ncbi:MAG: ABC transporter ATP-binding protein [Planctomycetota bacterium]